MFHMVFLPSTSLRHPYLIFKRMCFRIFSLFPSQIRRVPQDMANPAARVFAIPELLENMLLQVHEDVKIENTPRRRWSMARAPGDYDGVAGQGYRRATRRLFVLQRVSKSFKNTIDSSPELRRRMGLQIYQRYHVA